MCLYIYDNIKPKRANKEGYCEAWKVVTIDNEAPLHDFIYDIGENFSSRVCPSFPIDKMHVPETSYKVEEGFHIFLKRSDARNFKKNAIMDGKSIKKEKIIKVYYKPEYVVAYGTLNYSLMQTVVVSRLTIKSLEGV